MPAHYPARAPREFVFATPLTSWTAPHGLGRKPAVVTVYDDAGDQMLSDVANPDPNTTVIRHATP